MAGVWQALGEGVCPGGWRDANYDSGPCPLRQCLRAGSSPPKRESAYCTRYLPPVGRKQSCWWGLWVWGQHHCWVLVHVQHCFGMLFR